MAADVAVLTQDVFTVPPDKLPATRAALTIVGGRACTRHARRRAVVSVGARPWRRPGREARHRCASSTSCAPGAQPRSIARSRCSTRSSSAARSTASMRRSKPTRRAPWRDWGIALSRWSNPFAAGIGRPRPLQLGRDAVDTRASDSRRRPSASATTSPRSSRLYTDSETHRSARRASSPIATRWPAWRRRYPADTEAPIFYALSLAAAAAAADKTYARPAQGGRDSREALREPAGSSRARALHHPHATTCRRSPIARSRRRGATRAIAPSAPHALHMPSHTFTRVGYWQDSIDTNIASAASAKRDGVDAEELHAIDYQTYAYLQTGAGRGGAADGRRAAGDARRASIPTAIGVGRARLAPASSRWPRSRRATRSSAARGPRPRRSSRSRARFPYAEAMTWFARALGAARSGDAAATRRRSTRCERSAIG